MVVVRVADFMALPGTVDIFLRVWIFFWLEFRDITSPEDSKPHNGIKQLKQRL